MKYLLLIISFLMVSDCFSQIYELSNKEILLKIGIAKQDDSTIILTRTIINKTDDDIYVTPFSGEHDYYYGTDFFVVQMGGFAPGLYSELSLLLLLLNENDTIISSQKMHIALNRIIEMENICICFDYLNPSKQKEKMLLLECIHEYSKKRNNSRLYIISRKLYGNLCESIRLKMQFSIKNVPLM